MVTTISRETESTDASPVAVASAAPAVDISAIPDTPEELLRQWDTPRRSFLHAIPVVLTSVWDSITGPGMTEQQRIRREMAEFDGRARVLGPHV